MTPRSASRATALGLAAVAAIALWQALALDRWGFDGPDAGFFPQMMAVVCIVLALVVAIWPGQPNEGEDGEGDAGDEGAVVTVRSFAVYSLALLVMAGGAMSAGFAPTALLTTVLVMRVAERRSWFASIGFGLVVVLVCLVLFGWLLRVDLPEGPVERFFHSLVR